MTPSQSLLSPRGKTVFKAVCFIFIVGWIVATWGDIRANNLDINVGLALLILPMGTFMTGMQLADPDLADRAKQRRAAREQNTSEEENRKGRKFILITQSIAFVLALLATYLLRVGGIAAPNFDEKRVLFSLYGLFAIALMLSIAPRMKPAA